MKRTVTILMAGATLAVGFYVGNHVRAQQGGQQAARPPLMTRVGLVNIAQVIKNYNKFKAYQEAIKKEIEPLNKEIEAKKNQISVMKTQMEKPETPAAQKEQLEKQIKDMSRQMQDKMEEANKSFSKRSLDQLKIIYMDVEGAIKSLARGQGWELVFQYSDVVDPAEKYSPASIQAKLGNQACFPIYNDDRMDVTAAVIDMLNRNVQATNTPAAPAAPPRQ